MGNDIAFIMYHVYHNCKFIILGSRFWVQGSGFRVQGSGFGIRDSGVAMGGGSPFDSI